MTDRFYRFDSEAVAKEAMLSCGLAYKDPHDNVVISAPLHRCAMYELGYILGVDGWHVNIRVLDASLDLSGLEEYRVYPSSPSYVWA